MTVASNKKAVEKRTKKKACLEKSVTVAPATVPDISGSNLTHDGKNSSTNKSSADGQALRKNLNDESNIVYLGHIPHGFLEKEIRIFFSQFGELKKIKVFRSSKTRNPKGYAFIEFSSASIAKEVVEAVDGYMLLDKKLVCNVVPKKKCHDGMFKKDKTISTEDEPWKSTSELKDESAMIEKVAVNMARNKSKRQKKLEQVGINFVIK